MCINVGGQVWWAMVVRIVNMERFKFGHRPGFRAGFFRDSIWRNIILSPLNKICINSSTTRRHGGGAINDWILYKYTRCFDSGVRARTTPLRTLPCQGIIIHTTNTIYSWLHSKSMWSGRTTYRQCMQLIDWCARSIFYRAYPSVHSITSSGKW